MREMGEMQSTESGKRLASFGMPMKSISCKILKWYSIQREKHSYEVQFSFQWLDFQI